MKGPGLAFKLSLLIVAGGLLVLSGLLAFNYVFAHRLILKQARENAENLTRATVFRVEAVLAAAEKVPINLAATVEHTSYSEKELVELLRLAVQNNDEVYGAAVAFEPNAFDPGREYFAPYVYRKDGVPEVAYLGGPSYRYFLHDWYQLPKEMERPVWSEPYFDTGGGGALLSTFAVPFYQKVDGVRRFRGVVTADVSLNWLQAIVSSIHILDTGYAFLLSRNGVLVTHPRRDLIMNETIFGLAEARHDPELRRIGRDMMAGKSDFVSTKCLTSDEDCWLAYAPIPSSGWVLGALLPDAELTADVSRLNRLGIELALAGGVLLLLLVVLASRSITRPLTALASASDEIAHGNLESALPAVRSNDEVGRLAAAFGRMQTELRRTIEALAQANRTLEQRVERRTAELREKNVALEDTLSRLKQTQEQLVQQEKLASLGALTAGIAHEIKNPLNFVNNFAELSVDLAAELKQAIAAQSAALPAEEAADIDAIVADLEQNATKIREHGRRADRIVASMLQHSRGASGEKRPANLNAMLGEYLNLAYHGLRGQDPTFNAELQRDFDESLPPLAVVPEDLGRVFLNLCNNACWAVREKSRQRGAGYAPRISVQTRDLGESVEIRVRDNGTGIAASLRDKIFTPFFTTKPAGEGTGLGLSISYDIVVQEHGGEMRVDSLEGEWTEFVVLLPKNQQR